MFCSSLSDVFDNAVDPSWRNDLFAEMDDLDVALLTRAVQGLRDAGVLVAELQALALEAMPQVRREYLDLASKYAGTPYESDAAYQQVQTRYRRFEAAIDRAKDPASTGSAAVKGVQA